MTFVSLLHLFRCFERHGDTDKTDSSGLIDKIRDTEAIVLP